MRVLVACERSGKVRSAFRLYGHDAWSCDLVPADDGSQYHLQMDALVAIEQGWDLLIAHPPCTHLAVSGNRWHAGTNARDLSVEFVRRLLLAPVERIAVENPVSVISTALRQPDQVIQPWQFGHGETKATCLWLKNLPLLKPTCVVSGREARVWKMPPSADRARLRSETYAGVAEAMAQQWGEPWPVQLECC